MAVPGRTDIYHGACPLRAYRGYFREMRPRANKVRANPPPSWGSLGQEDQARWRSAVIRVGKTPESRARWLVQFAGDERAGQPESRSMELGWDLVAYLILGGTEAASAISGRPPVPEHEVRECQDWIKAGLTALARGELWYLRLAFPPSYIVRPNPLRYIQRVGVMPALVPFQEVVMRDALPTFVERLRFCKRQDCKRAFIRRKRQLFCSKRCGGFVRSGRYRSKNPDRVSDLRHERHVNKVRIKVGPKVIVKRRKRPQTPNS
jgi:hypothetical protein